MPLAATVGEAIAGFCKADTKPFGPIHEYVAPATVVEARFNGEPAHTGPFEDAVGWDGTGLTITAVVVAVLEHPETVAVTL